MLAFRLLLVLINLQQVCLKLKWIMWLTREKILVNIELCQSFLPSDFELRCWKSLRQVIWETAVQDIQQSHHCTFAFAYVLPTGQSLMLEPSAGCPAYYVPQVYSPTAETEDRVVWVVLMNFWLEPAMDTIHHWAWGAPYRVHGFLKVICRSSWPWRRPQVLLCYETASNLQDSA